MAYIQSYAGQTWLLPPSLESLIPEDHVAYLVESFVDSMDYSEFDEYYSGPGAPAYPPRILLKILVMGVLDRIRSSRRLAKNARENVVYMYLSEKLTPDFRTISDFRKNNPELVKELFKHVVGIAKSQGMIDLSSLSTDGTKVKASAANKRFLTKEELDFVLKFVDEELEEWAKQDEIEDKEFDELRGSDQLPGNSKKKIKSTVKQYIRNLKEKGAEFKIEFKAKLNQAKEEVEKNECKKVSLTDPESRFMGHKKGHVNFSYNGQVTVANDGFIVAADVTQDAIDHKQLKPQVNQTEENLGKLPENIPWNFDNGYFEGENLAFLADKKIDAHIAVQKRDDGPYGADKFNYDFKKNEYICPKGNPVKFVGERYDTIKKKNFWHYKAEGCLTCPAQTTCTKRKTGIRQLKASPHRQVIDLMSTKMQTKKAKETYALRKQTVEPTIGDIKQNKGLTEFLTRGLKTITTEFKLACTAANIKKMWMKKKEKNQLNQSNNTKNKQSNLFPSQMLCLIQRTLALT